MRPTRAATLTALAGALIPITSLFAPALSHAGAYTVAAGDEIAVHSKHRVHHLHAGLRLSRTALSSHRALQKMTEP